MPDNKEVFFTLRFTQEGNGPITCDLFDEGNEEEEIASAVGTTLDEALAKLIDGVTFVTSLNEN